jgi:hypothetical protein
MKWVQDKTGRFATTGGLFFNAEIPKSADPPILVYFR